MERKQGSFGEVLLAFLKLGCTSFGGPVAHLGYFRKELVERRRWCTEATLVELIALAQSLPGPSSSQVGFALGILRGGWIGGLAAWIGFTLPSALLMIAFAYGHDLHVSRMGEAVLHGLQLAAVAVVAQAVLSMQRSLAPDRFRLAMAMIATGLTLALPPQFSTLLVIAIGGVAGLLLFPQSLDEAAATSDTRLSSRAATVSAACFVLLLTMSFFLHGSLARIFATFYRSGALVFGGGHVVLPMLENAVVSPGMVTQQAFLAGYGATQALPGPLFTFAAYLGALVPTSSPRWLGGVVGLLGIFLPGLLLMASVLPFWSRLRRMQPIAAALKGVNASVVGILLATLYTPLWTSTVLRPVDFWIALAAFALLVVWKLQPWMVVSAAVAASCVAVFA